MSTQARLDAIPAVDIDDDGVFKYVLIKVYGKESDDLHKIIVRGFSRAEWHNDIYEEVSESLNALGLDTECLGGGRINHQSAQKKILVYGYSQGFGKADHEVSKKILEKVYSNYEIKCSDEGY